MVDFRERRHFFQMRDAAAVYRSHSDVVDQLFGDDGRGVPNRVEYLAQREWRGGVLAHNAKTFLQLSGDGVFEPKQVIRLKALAQSSRLDRRQPVMSVVQQVNVIAKLQA